MRDGARSWLADDHRIEFPTEPLATSPITIFLVTCLPFFSAYIVLDPGSPPAKSDGGAATTSPHDEAEEATDVRRSKFSIPSKLCLTR